MDNEEKKVKATKTTTSKKKTTATKKVAATKTKESAPKKTTTTKKTVKSEAKPKTEKKSTSTTTAKKTTVKKVVKTTPVKKEEVKEVVLPKEEVKEVEKKVVTKEEKVTPVKISKKELKMIRKKRYIIEAIILAVVALVALILLFNRTFLSTSYKNDSVSISIPRFSYFVSDEDSEVKFVTLRKSDYLKEYYNEYLEGFTFYSCAEGENTFYYNESTKTLIKEIEVEKKFAIKVVEITYDKRTPEEVCGLR